MPGCGEFDQADRRVVHARRWLSAGAMTLGVGAAMVGGAGVACAGTGAGAGSSGPGHSHSHPAHRAQRAHPATTSTAQPAAAPTRAVGSAKNSGRKDADRTAAPAGRERRANKPTAPAGMPGAAATVAVPAPTFAVKSLAAHANHAAAGTPAAAVPGRSGVALAGVAGARVLADMPVGTESTPVVTPTAFIRLPTPNQLIRGLQDFGRNLFVTVMNQVYGLRRNLETFGQDLAEVFGIRRVVITKELPYGDPEVTKGYYVAADDYRSAALATIAMAYGQLTHTAPDLQGFTDLAETTDSMVNPNQKMYPGPDSTQFVLWNDSYELLQDKNVRVIRQTFGTDQWDKALNALTNGLRDPAKAMIVAIKAPVDGQTGDLPKTVTVLGVDNVNDTVTINDPTRADGQGLTMSLDDFKAAWGGQYYQLVTTGLASEIPVAPPVSETRITWSLPAPNEIGRALRGAMLAIGRTIVDQINGARDNLDDLGADLARTFGLAAPTIITPPEPSDVEFGNYVKNFQYWIYQGNYNTCALMAVTATIGQLTGTMPPPQDIIDQAKNTSSGVHPGPMYDGNETYMADVATLLNMNGLNSDYTQYLKSEGNLALQNMNAALADNQAAIVFLNNDTIYKTYLQTYFGDTVLPPRPGVRANHIVMVLSVDLTKNIVYINDSALPKGQGFPVPLDEFMKAWKYSDFATVTAEPWHS